MDNGQASSYDLRYSPDWITSQSDFDTGSQVPGMASPRPTGEEERQI